MADIAWKLASDATAQALNARSRLFADACLVGLLTLLMLVISALLVRSISRTLRNLAGEMGEGAARVAGAAGQVSASIAVARPGRIRAGGLTGRDVFRG